MLARFVVDRRKLFVQGIQAVFLNNARSHVGSNHAQNFAVVGDVLKLRQELLSLNDRGLRQRKQHHTLHKRRLRLHRFCNEANRCRQMRRMYRTVVTVLTITAATFNRTTVVCITKHELKAMVASLAHFRRFKLVQNQRDTCTA